MAKAGEHILIVDDDRITRVMLARALTNSGYTCREAESGSQALEMVQSEPPALLLLDLDMPEIDGAEVLQRLRTHADATVAQVPAIMLTGHSGEQSEVLCLEAGANDFVTKPINLPVLRARIETQLRLQTLRGQLQQQNDELEAWRANLERDLAAARLTQQSLIPQKPPHLPGWEVAAAYRPVIQVGGDIYGWSRMRDGRVLFWIADATGHGAAAALLTTLAKLLFQHGTGEHDSPVAIMEAVNNDFRSIFGARSFMTAMCVALDPESGRGSVVGAGHPPLVVLRGDAGTELFLSSAPPLGLLERSLFEATDFVLEAGDGFLLYTDGIYGAEQRRAAHWNATRFHDVIGDMNVRAQFLLARLLQQVLPNESTPLPDDLAAVMVRREI